jgi:cytochrome c556
MKRASSLLTVLGAMLSFGLITACGGGGGGAPADADTPQGQAFQFRQSIMRVAASKLGTIGGMARQEIPLDEAVFVKATADLAVVAGMIEEGFEVEGVPTNSRSLPAIWENFDDFQQKAQDSATAMQGLAQAAADGGFSAAQGLVQGASGTCGGCHRMYRARAE